RERRARRRPRRQPRTPGVPAARARAAAEPDGVSRRGRAQDRPLVRAPPGGDGGVRRLAGDLPQRERSAGAPRARSAAALGAVMRTAAGVPVLGIAAYSGTGKTTLLRKVLPLLRAP